MDKNSTKDIANLAYSFTNGDYVMYKGKLDRIDAHMGGKVHLERRQDSVFIEDIKPVKLSFELLEKKGFEHIQERWFELIFEHSLFYIRTDLSIGYSMFWCLIKKTNLRLSVKLSTCTSCNSYLGRWILISR